MKQEEFIAGLKSAVRDTAADDIISELEKPRGRRPSADVLRRSAWYHALGEADKAMVAEIAKEVAHLALFGMFVVLDGGRAIEDGEEKGDLVLHYRNHGIDAPLNGEGLPPLHELYGAD
jgi:hypothetical protein